jgi:hypothetical protein
MATIVDNTPKALRDPMLEGTNSLQGYVMDKLSEWETYVNQNYFSQWDEYNRIWRGIWSAEDKTRTIERSRIITPASQQAVESSVCEIEEATFGQGRYFDIRDDYIDQQKPPQGPQDPQSGPKGEPYAGYDIEYLRNQLNEDMRKQKVRAQCSQVLTSAAVWGTGVAEVVMDEVLEMTPATEDIMGGEMKAYGVRTSKRLAVRMKNIPIKNFRIDPLSTTVEDAHGCGYEEFVSECQVKQLQEKGVYLPGDVGLASDDQDLEPNNELPVFPSEGKVKISKYFGLVPRSLYDEAKKNPNAPKGPKDDSLEDAVASEAPEENYVDLGIEGDPEDSYYVEVIVVIGNDNVLLKCEQNPYMMMDRPIVAFQWDVIPGLFHGRGVIEKGYNSQKALDAEIRARIDSLALTTYPMLAMDAGRIPRGHKPAIIPGKMILTNGPPSEVLQPFNFGNLVNQTSFEQAAALQSMVQQSTGAVDSSGIGGTVNSEATAAGISMSLGAIIKRQKRTLVNFQECFWLPFVEKSAWRYMQFDPEHYPVQDYKFVASSTLGIMAREYEVTQLVQLLQTMPAESPMYPIIVESVVQNMNISNREELIGLLRQSGQPDPEQQQAAKAAQEIEMALQGAQVKAVEAQANESNARAENYRVEAEEQPKQTEIKKIDAITKNLQPGTGEDTEFVKRLQIAEIALKERQVAVQERAQRTPKVA